MGVPTKPGVCYEEWALGGPLTVNFGRNSCCCGCFDGVERLAGCLCPPAAAFAAFLAFFRT
jgi:hypothetical protein